MFKQVNVCTSWVISKGEIKSCAADMIKIWSEMLLHLIQTGDGRVPAGVQVLVLNVFCSRDFTPKLIRCMGVYAAQQLLTVSKRHLTVVQPFQQRRSSLTWRGCDEMRITKHCDGFLWVEKRDKPAGKNFHLSLFCKKCVSDYNKLAHLMVSNETTCPFGSLELFMRGEKHESGEAEEGWL